MSFDWIIQELQIQSSVCEMTGDEKKVSDLAKAIAMLKKQNGYRLPKIINFLSIHHPIFQSPPAPNTSPGYAAGGIGYAGTYGTCGTVSGGTSSIAVGSPVSTWATGVQPISPLPTGLGNNVYPGMLGYNDNPQVGDEIFGIFNDKISGSMLMCIYTWQEKDNPEELAGYAAGWDPYDPIDGTQRWMPCKKHTHEKLLVVCLNECCPQNI